MNQNFAITTNTSLYKEKRKKILLNLYTFNTVQLSFPSFFRIFLLFFSSNSIVSHSLVQKLQPFSLLSFHTIATHNSYTIIAQFISKVRFLDKKKLSIFTKKRKEEKKPLLNRTVQHSANTRGRKSERRKKRRR